MKSIDLDVIVAIVCVTILASASIYFMRDGAKEIVSLAEGGILGFMSRGAMTLFKGPTP